MEPGALTYLWLALGGIGGALCRYHTARLAAAYFGTRFPWGMLLINSSGSFLLGLVLGLFVHHPAWQANALAPLLTTGFCGAYTTFSSFAWETVRLWHTGARYKAVLNLLGQPVLGGSAAWAGLAFGSLF